MYAVYYPEMYGRHVAQAPEHSSKWYTGGEEVQCFQESKEHPYVNHAFYPLATYILLATDSAILSLCDSTIWFFFLSLRWHVIW